jgi:hypothetical protein
MHGEVSTRPERLPDDGDFLLSVYASTRPELTGLGWPGHHHDAFIRMQFDAQTRHYRDSFPDAAYSVICVDGEPAPADAQAQEQTGEQEETADPPAPA